MESGGGINPLDRGRSDMKINGSDWTTLDVNRACTTHANRHSADRTISIIQEVTGAPFTSTVHVKPEHRGELIARLCRGMIGRPHMHVAHKDGL